jgi:MFS transporter, PAT family, beta-lactamase induction signal transducer AmpG
MNEVGVVGTDAMVALDDSEEQAAVARERPWIFGLLVAPNAVVATGIIQGGVLAYLMSVRGISGLRSSQIISLLTLPTTIYCLWSPITDFLMRRRTWLLVGAGVSGVLFAAAFTEKSLASPVAIMLLFAGACFSQLVVSSCGGIMGALKAERSRRLAGSFYQGGALAFGAIAVFVLIMLSGKSGRGVFAWMAGALIAVPALAAFAAPGQDVIVEDGFGRTMLRVWEEFQSTFLRWKAIPYTLTLLFPLGSGAAMGLLPGVSRFYGVGGQQTAWMNGIAGAMLMAGGSLAATLIPARIRASVAYLTVALINAATLGVLWLGPQRPSTYYVGVMLYLFTVGTCYAMFTAVVLEFLGNSGKSGSGRYSIINSMGNVPVVYMLALDGWGGNRWGARGLSGTESVAGMVGASILLSYFLMRKRPEGALSVG